MDTTIHNSHYFIHLLTKQLDMKSFFTSLFNAKNLALSLFFCVPMVVTAQVIFTQSFGPSTTTADYVNSTPSTNQLDFAGVSGTGSPLSGVNASNKFRLYRTNTGTATFARTTDLALPAPTFIKMSFKISVSQNNVANIQAGVLYFGSGFANSSTSEASPHSRINLGYTGIGSSSPGFYIHASANTYTTEQTVTWYINNSGSSADYMNPSGGTTTLANDAADIWVGTTPATSTLVAAGVAAVSAGAAGDLTDFKVYVNQGIGSIIFDDIEVSVPTVVLPVSLTNFNANKTGTTNQLTWTIESEINNKGYDVQRQNANGTWQSLGFVKGIGKASTYTFEDNAPLSISYYRLRQIDFDGTETLSKVVSVNQSTKGRISITPNPTSDKVNINLNQNDVSNETATIVLSDMTGRQVLTQTTTAGAFQLDLSNLAKGMYVVTVQSNNAIYQEKIIRQ
jgi:hypothetical protein